MRTSLALVAVASVALAVGGASASTSEATSPPPAGVAAPHAVHVCARPSRPGGAACLAVALTTYPNRIGGSATPLASGYTPADIQRAYDLSGLQSNGRTVAIVDAYGYSHLESDLAVFRSTYGLAACTTGSGCLTVLDQDGGTSYPRDDQGWDLEQALDVDAVSSACPDCRILVVEATTAALADLRTAENTAAGQPGVVAISNSYAGPAHGDEPAYDHRGIAVTAGTGDAGFQAGTYPASDSHVVAVGGTSLVKDHSTRGFAETAWPGSGSGCSRANPRPPWQRRLTHTTCASRATSDVSAAADPAHGGLNVYDSALGGFVEAGGTSESSPLIAAVYALSGDTRQYPARLPYGDPQDLYDITKGSNGGCGPPLCRAGVGWDGPTGVGTPHGVSGF